jgi:dTDP-4-amino-4,6-dideoxygalactose transaminase
MTSLSYERSKGHSTSYDVIELGYNYRMDDIHAAIGLVQLDKIRKDLQRRAEIRNTYIGLLKSIENINIPFSGYREFCSNYIFTIILNDSNAEKRELIRNKLAEAGIQTSVHYPAVHRFRIYRDFKAELPVTEYVTDNLITLPMFAALTDSNIQYIVNELRKALN